MSLLLATTYTYNLENQDVISGCRLFPVRADHWNREMDRSFDAIVDKISPQPLNSSWLAVQPTRTDIQCPIQCSKSKCVVVSAILNY